MPAPSRPINLLPQSAFETSFTGRFLQWAVTSGRYIIILTEAVVIVAFLSRFKLDQDLANLSDTIKGQRTLLERQLPLENQFRFTQSRLNATHDMLGRQVLVRQRFDKLLTSLPTSVKLVSVKFERNQTTVQATTLSEQSVAEFLARVKQDGFWKELEMSDFANTDGAFITFTLVMKS